jgi:hypothetical protein
VVLSGWIKVVEVVSHKEEEEKKLGEVRVGLRRRKERACLSSLLPLVFDLYGP